MERAGRAKGGAEVRTIKTSRGLDYTRLSAMLATRTTPFSAEDICTKAHLSRERAASALATLELRGVLTKMPKSHPHDLPTYTVTRAEDL